MRRKWADDFWKLHKNMSCTFSLRLGWMVEGIREIINISRKGNKVINCIQNGNMTVNSPKEIGEELNNHFTSIAKNIRSTGPSILVSQPNPKNISECLEWNNCSLSQLIIFNWYFLYKSQDIPQITSYPTYQKRWPHPKQQLSTNLTPFQSKWNSISNSNSIFIWKNNLVLGTVIPQKKSSKPVILGSMLVEYFLTYKRHLTLSTTVLRKLNYYGIRGRRNNWFCSYLQDRMPIVSMATNPT